MFPTRTVTFWCALAVVLIATGGESHADNEPTSYRLPRDTEPVAYGLRLVPKYDPKQPSGHQYTFLGQVYILIRVNSITPKVTVNAKDMLIKSVAVTEYKTQTDLEVDDREMLPDKEQLVIYMAKNLLAGRLYELKIMFQGLLRTDMTGFYRSSYRQNDETKWMAVTQFKPTYARRAFPCYDEPQYKTPFNVTLGRQAYQMTLSNMPRYMTKRMDYYGFWADSFETTPPLPTYLVGAVVGDAQFQPSHDVEGTDVSIYTYLDHLSQTGYAMEESASVFKTMQNYTNSTHELVKMDFVAVPDFDGNGMENWGVNTYRERYLLNDDNSKTKFKEQSTMVIQQQQSHQWFGNLVTCSWWDFSWLNEGFSRYFQYFATELIKPNWRLEELFVVEQHQTALLFDQTPRHPMTTSVKTSDDVQGIFDEITYNKAAAIIRMIRSTVTEKNFHEPLKLYLQYYRHGVANPSHLWSVFENYYFDTGFQLSDQVSFTDFAVSWTDQSGYPVINVQKVDATRFKITQKMFSIWPSSQKAASWYVPITYTTDLVKNFEDLKPNVWLKPESAVKYITDPTPFTWYIFNLRSSGFYRVNYDHDNWNRLVNLLNNPSHTDLHVLNRAQLIDDSFNLARAGMLEYSTALNLSLYLKHEDDFVPWYTAIDCLSYVVERMRRSAEGYEHIKSYVRNLAELVYEKAETLVLQRSSVDHMTVTSWHKFSVWACYLDGQNCTTRAMENFKKWSSGEKISADMKDAALCTAIKMGNESTWQGVFNVYTKTNSTSEKDSAQSALACSRDPLVLYKYLNLFFNSTNGGPVRLQDYKDICDAMSLTPQGIEALTNFLMINIETILRTIPTGQSIITYTYRVLAAKVALDGEIIKLYNLKNAERLPTNIKESFEESYVHVEQNLLWYNKYHAEINQWTGAPADPTMAPPGTTEPVTTIPPAVSSTIGSPTISSTIGSSTVSSTVGPPTTVSSTVGPPTTVSSTVGSPTVSSTIGSPTVSSTVGSPTVSSTIGSSTVSSTVGPPTVSSTVGSPTSTARSVTESIDSKSSTASGVTGSTTVGPPIVTASTYEQFDFDQTTFATISRCPNSGGRTSYTGTMTIFTVIVALTVSLKLHATL